MPYIGEGERMNAMPWWKVVGFALLALLGMCVVAAIILGAQLLVSR